MKNLILTLYIIVAAALGVTAQSKLDAYTRLYLLNSDVEAKAAADEPALRPVFPTAGEVGGQAAVRVIVKLEEGCADDPDLSGCGATVEARIGDMLIVTVPVGDIERLCSVEAVKSVSVERPIRLKNSNTRTETRQSSVNETVDLDGNYLTGQGVIVGMIDTGIDYNHLNFLDADGNSRVGYAIKGTTEYTDSALIAVLTTDNTAYDHGTHTTGTVAGSYTDNGLQGMAPDASLALCGMNDTFTDATILLACKGIIDYADSVGKPVVINMSIGTNDGPHDGSDALCTGMDALCKEGVVMVVAAGNEGDMQIYIGKEFTEADTCLSTIIYDIDYRGNYYYNIVQAFSFNNRLPRARFFVISKSTNEILFTTDTITTSADSATWTLSGESNYSDFKEYYTTYSGYAPDITVTASYADDKSYLDILVLGRALTQNSYYVGMELIGGQPGDTIHIWGADAYTELISNGCEGFTDGDASKSINSMACGDNMISAGSYNAVNRYTSINGYTYSYSTYPVGYVSSFSSYGVDMRGISRPDVCAPGIAVLSSFNSYYSTGNATSSIVDQVTYGGRTYTWGTSAGTSMSTAVVSGIIATWLQYKPTLTGSEVREVIQNSSVVDSYVEAGDAVQWGSGKIDAYAGLEYLMSAGVNDVEVAQDNVLIYPNPSDGRFKVYAQGETGTVRLNVYSVAGALVHASTFDASAGSADVDIAGSLAPGVYVVQVSGEKVNYSTRMIIR